MSAKKTTKIAKAKAPKATKAAKPAPTKKALKAEGEAKSKKLGVLDAAVKVLGDTGEPLNCKEMIELVGAKGYWTSPGGKTPSQTLYAAIAREIATKGKDARFKKTERGRFAAKSAS